MTGMRPFGAGPAVAADAIRAPANVTVVASAPHHEVMRRADLVVTHGGHGTEVLGDPAYGRAAAELGAVVARDADGTVLIDELEQVAPARPRT